MGEIGEFWRDVKEHGREMKDRYAIDCPHCNDLEPKRFPSRLMPGQRCRVCGYVAPRRKRPVQKQGREG